MAILKCKMCGGDLHVEEGITVCECEYCLTKQTVPSINDDKKQKLYDRANKLRFNCDFDKAAGVYENIVNEFPDDAESYWGLILCKYGIEYVDDPATGRKIPTCHRSSFDSVMDDPDFEMVMENADSDALIIYRQEAKQIEELRRSILEVSGKEEPYDIFICYKETDDTGSRTLDSVLAQDVYDALTDKGYRVFFSRISLEDKLGTEYEPYIFAALNSARVMLAFGTSYQNYNAVWVKNEWSRFLKLMAADKEKYLIPCFKDIDAYDIPKEFAKFQAQDLGKVGAIQDLLRGIDKIFGKDKTGQAANQTDARQAVADAGLSALNAQTTALLKRGYMALEDGEFDRANDFFEQVLNNDAESGQAYWGKVLSAKKARNADELGKSILQTIDSKKTGETVVFTTKLVELAREADETGLLESISDKELAALLSDFKSDDIQYENDAPFFENQLEKLDADRITQLLASRDYERALQYKDSLIETGQQRVLDTVKAGLQDALNKEHQKADRARSAAEEKNKQIRQSIAERLSPVKETYEKNKTAIDEAKKEADRQAEEAYNAAYAKAEADYQTALEKSEYDYQNTLTDWEKAKADFEAAEAALPEKKAQIQAEIKRLQNEKDALKGLFSGKKRKELDEQIAGLQQELNTLKLPEKPGEKPEKKALPVKPEPPKREDYKPRPVNQGEDILLMAKCAISSAFSAMVKQIDKLKTAEKGSTVSFGRYEQGDGVAPIDWLVLDRTKDKVLLISRYALDCKKYNEKLVDITWENCSLRAWLNSGFIASAFTATEKELIADTLCPADKDPLYKTPPGNPTTDKVFLLSIPEVNNYFSSGEERQCSGTAYCYAQGAEKYNNDNCWWWLRSPGRNTYNAAFVYGGGSVYNRGGNVDYSRNAIRPALWVNLDL